MRFFLATVFSVFFLALNTFSQTTTPAPTPPPDTDEDVVKISTTLIQIDVSVTDSGGKVINDLKPEEVEIYENGKKQEISNFSFISSVGANTETIAKKRENISAVPPPSQVRADQVKRTIALVVDDLTLSFESTYYVRRALRKFVDEQMQPGDLVAVIRTSGGIGALQQFTTDKRQLYAAIEKVNWNPSGGGGMGAFAPIEATPLEQGQLALGNDVSEEQLEAEKRLIQNQNNLRQDIFATGTLGAINYVVRGMNELPGRKSIMLLSDGFQLFSKTTDGFTDSTRVLDSLRRLVDLANRASVVVYTMDARGLVTTGFTAQDNSFALSSNALEQRLSDRRDTLFNTQEGLVYLARQTGGFPILNSNDLSGGIRKILDDQSYYLIGYQPDVETFDPKTRRFNKLEIKVNRKGANVRYRSGFFGVSDEQFKNTAKQTPYQQITAALTSPFAVNDISMRLNALFNNNAQQGSFVRSFLHIKAQDLKFNDEADGGKKAVFDVLAIIFGDNGVPVEQISKTYTMNVKPDVYREIMKSGFVYDFTFPVRKPGAYQFRIAIRDQATEKVGSANQFVEVPNLKKEGLKLSGIVLENIGIEDWRRLAQGKAIQASSNPLSDTALRQFKRNTVLSYGTEVYNAKSDASRPLTLVFQTKIFRDGKVLFEGKPQPVGAPPQTDWKKIDVSGSLNLGSEMQLGDYVLQIVVTDSAAKGKYRIGTQFVQFEIVQ